ncbi:type II toxin-antitoxin system PemK/MazF family toxin, partial [Liquorilactobacillus vini]
NRYSPTVIIAAITAQIQKPKMPTHVGLRAAKVGIEKDSVVLLEQIRTIDKQRLQDKIAHLTDEEMLQINQAIDVSLGLTEIHKN